jgi:hypothetical protein
VTQLLARAEKERKMATNYRYMACLASELRDEIDDIAIARTKLKGAMGPLATRATKKADRSNARSNIAG